MTQKDLNKFSKISPYLVAWRQQVVKNLTSSLEGLSQKLSSNQAQSKFMQTLRSPLLKTLEVAVSSLQKFDQPQPPVITEAVIDTTPIANNAQTIEANTETNVTEPNTSNLPETTEISKATATTDAIPKPIAVDNSVTESKSEPAVPEPVAAVINPTPELKPESTTPSPKKAKIPSKPPATTPLQDKVKAAVREQAKPPLKNRVKVELGEAWQFVIVKLVPAIVKFVTVVVEKIDPPLSLGLSKFVAIPAIAKGWQNFQTSEFSKRFSTATAPIWRSVTQTLAQFPVPASIKPILAKPTGAIAVLLVLTLVISLRPHPTHANHPNSGAIAKAPIPIAQPQPNPINKLVPPEKSDIAVSPEQIVVAAIQEQVSSISIKYGEGLIGSIQTNFKLGRLMVQLTDAWYQLAPERQQELVNEIQQRSLALTFKKLLIADSANNLLARSPAIGTDMVILKR